MTPNSTRLPSSPRNSTRPLRASAAAFSTVASSPAYWRCSWRFLWRVARLRRLTACSSGLVDEYTATAPEQLPKVEMPAEKRQALQDRVEAFRKAVNDGTATEPLVLTSDDLNALIEENDELKGMIYVKIEGDELKGKVSIPLDKLPLAMFKGRYLNGEADLKASLFDGVLIVTLDAIEVNGKRPPEEVHDRASASRTSPRTSYKDAKNAEMIRKLESLEIKDGKIILKVRAKPGATRAEPGEKAAVPVEGRAARSQVNPRPSRPRTASPNQRRQPNRPRPRRRLKKS